MDVAAWLRGLGLERYVPAFRDNEIDWDALPKLSAQDLKDLGVVLGGHRRRLLDAIAALGATAPATSVTAAPHLAPTADPERRQLTVMFCDLVGSTALSARLDPEDLREVIGAYHRAVAEVVAELDGFVAKYMGDGVLVYFGYPRAHEDDAERAVRAGLGLIDAVGRLDVKSAKLQARVGIATGLVVVGDLIGEGSAQEQSVVGETPNLAARLQALAEPDAVVITAGTRRLVGDLFEYRDLGAVEVKGIATPVQAWQVLHPSVVASRFEAMHASSLTSLVGRDEELDLLLRRWARAKAGAGQVVLVSGEPGLGKSRLTAALEESLHTEPHHRLRYFCSPYHQDSALFPFIDQLGRASGFARDDPPWAKLEKLEALLARAAPPEEDVAFLADLLSLPASERHPLPHLSPQRKKERTLEALIRQLEGLAHRQPMVVVFEDAHWIDATSRELLDLTVERVGRLPVLLILTFRPEFQPPWTGQPHVTTISLRRLARDESDELVRRLIDNSVALPSDLVDEIVERTDGVPLFLEELTKAVLETAIAGTEISAAPAASLTVPATLHASLMARLDRLGSAAKEIAQVGATIGREFSYELLATTAKRTEAELRDAVDRLVGAGLVFQRGLLPQATFLFKHALVQDIAYGTLLRGPRHILHRRIAIALEEKFSEAADTPTELLAQHWAGAGSFDKAISYWLKSARRSITRSAMAEAKVQLEKGLGLLSSLPEEAVSRRYELALQIVLWRVLMAVRGPAAPETGRALLRARQLCEALGETSELPQIMGGQWLFYAHGGEQTAAQRIAEDLLAFGVEHHDPAAIASGHWTLGWNSFVHGRGDVALSHFQQCADEAAPSGITLAILGLDAAVSAAAYLALIKFCLGHVEQALIQSKTAIYMARQLVHPETEAVSNSVLCRYFWLARNYEGLKERSTAFDALMVEHGFAFWRAHSDLYQGWFQAENGSAQEGVSAIERVLSDYRASGNSQWLPFMFAVCANACQKAKRLEQALQLLAEAAQVVERSGDTWFEPELERLRGEMLIAAGSAGEAEPHFAKAIVIARDQSAKTWELRAATDLARLWRDQGRSSEASDLLAPIYGWFTEGFDTPDLKEAKALLDELA